MKYMPGLTDFFMSPVTGRINLFQFPDLTKNYIIIGGIDGRPITSPALIDLRLEVIELRNRLAKTSFILQHPSDNFNKSQALDALVPGILQHSDGVVSIASLEFNYIWIGDSNNRPAPQRQIFQSNLPDLLEGNIWIGDDDNKAVPQSRIDHDNLPSYTPIKYKKIWRMDILGIPQLSDDLTDAITEIEAIQADIVDIKSDILTIIGELTEIWSAIGSLVSTVTGISATLTTLELTVTALGVTVTGISATLTTLGLTVTALGVTVTGLSATLTALGVTVSGILAANVTLVGNVTGSATIASLVAGGDIDTTLNMTLDEIPAPVAPVSMNGHKITNLVMDGSPSGTDAVNVDYLNTFETDVDATIFTLTGTVTNLETDVLALQAWRLVETGYMDIVQDQIIELYGLTGDGTVTLTGDVTGSGTTGVPFPTTLNMTLDQIPAPVADVNMNNFYITNIAMPAVPGPGDVVNVTYLTTYVTDAIAAGTIELTGAVTASGTIGTPFATSLNSTVALPTGGTTFTTTEQFSGMKIKSNFVPPSGQISNIDIKIENQVGSYARFRLGSTDAAGVDPNGTFAVDFQPAVGDYTQVFAFNNTYMSLFLPLAVQEDMNMTSNRIYNLANPVLPNDATNKTYVDALSAVSGSFSIGGNLDMTTGQINNVAMAETPASTDAVNVSYMNSRIATLIAAGSVTLTGAVTGTGFVGTPFATSLNSTVALPTGGTTFTTTEQFSGMKIKNNYFTGTSGNQTVDLKLVNSIGASVRFLMNSTGSSGTNPDGAFSLNFLNSDASVETQVFSSTKTAMTIYLPLSVEEGMNMTNNKIINLATPTLSNDAATKGYVDGRTITLTGNVTGTGTVGSSFSTTLAMTLNTIPVPVASVSLNSQKIINLASPTTGTDAANRTFVETGATQYGGLYSSGGLSVSLTAGVWAKVTALNTIGSLSSFTAPPVSYRLVYSGPTTRVFCLNANVTFTCPLSNNGMFFGICVNGVLISPSVLNLVTSTSTLTTNNISICGYANLASTDYVEVWVYSNNNTTITVQSAQLAVFAI